jgi:hypothetical protein
MLRPNSSTCHTHNRLFKFLDLSINDPAKNAHGKSAPREFLPRGSGERARAPGFEFDKLSKEKMAFAKLSNAFHPHFNALRKASKACLENR